MDDSIRYVSTKQTYDGQRYPFTEGQMRFYLANRHKNGLSRAVRKLGKRLYLRLDLFDQWVEDQQNKRDK